MKRVFNLLVVDESGSMSIIAMIMCLPAMPPL